MDIILSLHTYFESNFGFHYPTELVYFIVGLYQKLTQWNIRCGISHNFLFKNDKIYSWGLNNSGQLGHNNESRVPSEVKFDFGHVMDIGCGNNFSVIKTIDGEVYMWIYTKTKINLVNVKKISCAHSHSLALVNQSIYAWGNNEFGQLGLGSYKSELLPQKVNLESVIDIISGWAHCAAFTSDGNIYVWGNNTFGQLGLGHHESKSLPTKLDFPDCVSISNASRHSLALTVNGCVYSCGYNNLGQLGLGDDRSQNSFQKLKLKNIRIVHAKGAHSMCVSLENELYAWGNNECGELGLGHKIHQCLPQKVKLNGIKEIDSGYGYAIAITLKNEIYVWGYNDHGQLGLGHDKDYDTPQRLLIK